MDKLGRSFAISSILLNCYIFYQFLNSWINPQIDGIGAIYTLPVLIAFEFIMVHSGVFMASFQRSKSIIFFIIFYGVFAWQFNKYVTDDKILITYLIVVFNRMRFAFFNASKQQKDRQLGFSGLAVICYAFALFPVLIFHNYIPKLGLTAEFLSSSHFAQYAKTDDIFTKQPQVPFAIGCLYYTLLISSELANDYLEKQKK